MSKKIARSRLVNCVVIIMSMMFVVSCTKSAKLTGNKNVIVDSPVIISEIYIANPNLKDEFGKDPGWVEFYNPHDSAVNLDGFYLTNNAVENPRRWRFGDVVVPPRERILVFMSRRDNNINLIERGTDIQVWADNTNGGGSSVENRSVAGQNIGGVFRPVNNNHTIGYSVTDAGILFSTNAPLDMSGINRILLRGFIDYGTKLQFQIILDGESFRDRIGLFQPVIITGTGWGIEDDLYTIDLDENFIRHNNITRVAALRFSNVPGDFRNVEFNFNSIIGYDGRIRNIHTSFTLANNGGRLFLMDDSENIRDSVTYPARTLDLSFAKNFETQTWAHAIPTPREANTSEFFEYGQLPPPIMTEIPNSGNYNEALSFVIPQGIDGAIVACDFTGAFPTANSQYQSGMTVNLTNTSVMRCAQFKDDAYRSDPIMRTYIIGRLPDLPVVSIAVDPFAMFDSTHGIYSMGPNANVEPPYLGANFWEKTELPVQIEFFERGMELGWSHRAGLRIFGGHSRMNPKKSVVISFRDIYGNSRLNYPLFPDNPELTRFKHFILRNNGQSFFHDYIRDMLMTSLTEGIDIDYQRGRAVVVFYNGEYFGIHNLRERSNADYFETKYGIDENSIDLVELKDSNYTVRGSDNDYNNILRPFSSLNEIDDNIVRQINEHLDIDNFTYNYMFRIYYRDFDFINNNMKRWRTHTPPSRWRWFMYDTDHGFGLRPRNDRWYTNAIARSTLSEFVIGRRNNPNYSHSLFLFRKLLQNDNYRNSFVNRFSLLMATYLADDRVGARIDALMLPIEDEIPHDQERWAHNISLMNAQMDTIRTFNANRRVVMQNELRDFFNFGEGVDFTVSVVGNQNGRVRVHNLEVLNNSATFTAYPEVPVVLNAVSENGAIFESWSDGVTDAERVVTVSAGQNITLHAIFL